LPGSFTRGAGLLPDGVLWAWFVVASGTRMIRV
jgi:hypothetical protein